MNSRERFLAACQGQPVDRAPVWIMRQAGRTLPEYNAVREHHSFWEICRTPELAAEVTVQPVRRFPLDAAIIFSDILTVPVAMGLDVQFEPSPKLGTPIRSAADVAGLVSPDVDKELGYVGAALRETRSRIGEELTLLGFAGAPFTIASYMVEGGGSKSYSKIKGLMYNDPGLYAELLTRISDLTADYLAMQIKAGADAVQIFDSWAGELSPPDFEQFALPYVRRIIEKLNSTGAPIIYYVNGIGNVLEPARDSGADVLGIDWRVELATVRQRLGENTVVQGNLDPALLFAPAEVIKARLSDILFQTSQIGHIVNLGHGIQPDTPLEGIAALVNTVVNRRSGENERNN